MHDAGTKKQLACGEQRSGGVRGAAAQAVGHSQRSDHDAKPWKRLTAVMPVGAMQTKSWT